MNFVLWLKKAFYWLIGIVAVIIVLSQGLPWYTVSPGEIALITRLGKLQENYATEGLNFKIPLIDKVIRINIQTQKVEATANAASKDLQNISATIAVNGNVQAAFAKELYRNLGDASLVAEKIINPSIQESVKAATAKYTAEELITKRTAVSQDIRLLLVEKLEKRGIQVSDVNIVNFQFSADFDAAIEKKVKAEQEALAEKNKLESVKFQAQQSIERSKAEAESIRIQAEAIKSQWGQEYVNLKWIEKWDGKLPQTSLGQSNGLILNLKQ
jgi:regulator of protease activity HflC (stomatin/prohibitin superfamily)